MHCEHTYRKVSLPDSDSDLSFTYVFLCSVGGHKKMFSTTREFADEREFENLGNQSTESITGTPAMEAQGSHDELKGLEDTPNEKSKTTALTELFGSKYQYFSNEIGSSNKRAHKLCSFRVLLVSMSCMKLKTASDLATV